MGKKKKLSLMPGEGVHEIVNKKRPRARRLKRGGITLSPKKKRRILKISALAATIAVVSVAAFSINSMFKKFTGTITDFSLQTPYVEPLAGTSPTDFMGRENAIDNISFLNYRFKQVAKTLPKDMARASSGDYVVPDNVYSEMHGTTVAMGISQSVNTYKQFNDGVLVMADITTSSLVNEARQFCYVGNSVIWREADRGAKWATDYESLMTMQWPTGEPYRNVTLDWFRSHNGLPGTEFTVYVINDETLLDATPVTDNGDGTYTQTYFLNPADDLAPIYYRYQMAFTGGLSGLPDFDWITVTYTWDEDWRVLSSVIEESCFAPKGPISAPCKSSFTTVYEYDTPKAFSPAYEEYFKQYENSSTDNVVEEQRDPTALDCLTGAFASVLNGKSTFDLALDLGDKHVDGKVTVDMTNGIALDAKIGALGAWYDGTKAYLSYGGVKGSLDINELLALLAGKLPAGGEGEGAALDTDALLSSLANGDFHLSEDKKHATLSAKLELGPVVLPVSFAFNFDDEGVAILEDVTAKLNFGTLQGDVRLTFGNTPAPQLSEGEKANFVELVPYAQSLLDLFSSDNLRAKINYQGDFLLAGNVDISLKDKAVRAQLTVGTAAGQKTLGISYAGGDVYLSLGGIRLKANAKEAISLVQGFLPKEANGEGKSFDLTALVASLLSEEFANNFAVSESDSALTVAIKGTEVLKALGFNFDLGDISLTLSDSGVSASAYGATLTLGEGKPFTVETEGYVDAVKYVNALLALFQNEVLAANGTVSYGDITAELALSVAPKTLQAKADIAITYKGATQNLTLYYGEGETLYLALGNIKVKATAQEIASLVKQFMGETQPALPAADLNTILNTIFAIDFDTVFATSESEGTMSVAIKGTELLKALGVNFELGDVTISVKEGELAVASELLDLVVKAGEAFTMDTEGFVQVGKYADDVKAVLAGESIAAEIDFTYQGLQVEGRANVSIQPLQASAALTLTYQGASKNIVIGYTDAQKGDVFLTIDGLKVKANIADAVALVQGVLGQSKAAQPDTAAMLEKLFALDFTKVITVTETEDALALSLDGTEILKALGLDFALGSVDLGIANDTITLSAYGANVALTAGGAFTVDTAGFVDAVKYAEALLDLFQSEVLAANGTITYGDITAELALSLSLAERAAQANITVEYAGKQQAISLQYANGTFYLALGGVKVYATPESVVELVKQFMGADALPALPAADLNTVLNTIFAIDFDSIFTLGEQGDTLNVTVKGTELLKALGVNFELGDVALSVKTGEVAVTNKLLSLTVTAGKPFTVETEGYVDAVKYVNALLALFQNDVLAANGTITYGDITAELALSVAPKTLQAKADIAITYKDKTQNLTLHYGEGETLYLALGNIKVKATAQEIASLVKQFMGETQPALPAADLNTILNAIFAIDFDTVFATSESEGTMSIAIKGTELLRALGVNFELGDVTISVKEGELAVASGLLDLVVTAGEAFTMNTEGFVQVGKYADDVKAVLAGESIAAEINFTYQGLQVEGRANVSIQPLQASAELTLTYQGASKNIVIGYTDVQKDTIFLTVDGLKMKTSISGAIALVQGLLTMPNTGAADTTAMLEKLFALDFTKVITVTEQGDALALSLDGTAILKALGLDFALGTVDLGIANDTITLSAYGANVALTAGEAFTVETEGYTDFTTAIDKIGAILNAGGISFSGEAALTIGTTKLNVVINEGAFSFRGGLQAYLDLSLVTGSTETNLLLSITEAGIKFAYGNVGADVAFADLPTLEAALLELYARVAAVVNQASDGGELLPAVDSLNALIALITGGKTAADLTGGFDLGAMLNSLTLTNTPDGLLALSVMGVNAILSEGANGLALTLGYTGDGISVTGGLDVAAIGAEGVPAMPTLDYLGAADFAEMLDYVGTIVEVVAEPQFTLTLNGSITSTEEAYAAAGGKRYDLSATLEYYSGGAFPFKLDLAGKTFTVSTDVYVRASFALVAATDLDESMYVDLTLLDSDMGGAKNGELDVFVSLSKRAVGDSKRDPIMLYAPASELMTLLSSGCAMLGVDSGILNDFMLLKWLSQEEVGQLKGLGASLKVMISDILSGNAQTILPGLRLPSLPSFAPAEDGAEVTRKNFIDYITVASDRLEVGLNGKALFGAEGTFALTLGKGADGKLTMLGMGNLVSGTDTISLNAGFAYETVTPATVSGNYLNVTGLASLLRTIARSATHAVDGEVISGEQAQHNYVLNSNFYIDGYIDLDLSALGINVGVNIRMVAFSISIDEEGVIGVNVRFEYDALKKLGITVINGNTVVDLTGKNGMVYIKRTQTTNADGKGLPAPEVRYRAMPLSNFGGDLFNQIGFMFNMNSSVVDMLKDIKFDTVNIIGDDHGGTLRNLLAGYTYTPSGAGNSWKFSMNGGALTGGVLKNIDITMRADAEGKLRNLELNTGMSMTGLSMTVESKLTYHNPMGVMDDGVKDVTTDIADLLEGAMSKKLKEAHDVKWAGITYLDGEFAEISYMLAGNKISSQFVCFDATTRELYADLVYPDLTAYEQKGYTLVWNDIGGRIPENRQIAATYTPNRYVITFESEREVAGWQQVNGKWTYTAEYVYGTEFTLPFGEDIQKRITGFADASGKVYKTGEDMKAILANTTLTAQWEDIDYTVTFMGADGEIEKQTFHYGDEIVFPADPMRTGYTFAGWDQSGTVTGDMTINALFTANVYEVTLESSVQMEGFAAVTTEAGTIYRKVVRFTYDSDVALESNLEHEAEGVTYILRGFRGTAGDTIYTSIPNVADNATYTAVWEEKGYDIVFVQEDGTEIVLNRHEGEVIAAEEIPAVAPKTGYTGSWENVNAELGYVVTGEARIAAVYTPNTYTVTFVSEMAYEGYTAEGDAFVKRVVYTYDGAAVLPDSLGNLPGYWFKGFYAQENATTVKPDEAAGEKVERVEHILADVTYYAYWQDNTVTVKLYSDAYYDGSEFDITKNGYFMEQSFNDTYTLNVAPTVAGYQQLGWWTKKDGAWQDVTDVSALDGAEIWAVWISEIDVEINSFTTTDFMGGKRYNIAGSVTGGEPMSGMSSEIFTGSKSAEAEFIIRGADGDFDNPGNKAVIDVTYDEAGVGTFVKNDMNSGKFSGDYSGKKAAYGGVELTMTFKLGSHTVTSTAGACVSLDIYTVTFVDEMGGEVGKVEGVRRDCPFDTFDDRKFSDELAEKNGIVVPQKEHYSAAWQRVEIVGNTTVSPVYLGEECTVTFVSAYQFDGSWTANAAGGFEKSVMMRYGAQILVTVCNEIKLNTTVAATESTITLPVAPEGAAWKSFDIAEGSASFTAGYNLDTVTLKSDIAFDYNGASYSQFGLQFGETIGLPEVTATNAGHTFLGWFMKEGESWKRVTTLEPTVGEEKANYTVEALWTTTFGVEITSKNKSGNVFAGYGHTFAVKVSGGKLVGAFAEQAEGTLNYRAYFDNDGAYAAKSDSTERVERYDGITHSKDFSKNSGAFSSGWKYANVVVTLQYVYGDITINLGDALGSEVGVHVSAKF